MPDILVRALVPSDWEEVRRIYLEGIATGNATFESAAPSWESWDSGHDPHCRFVAVRDGECLGWVGIGRISTRSVYAGVAEVSVYIAESSRGLGVGRALLAHLIEATENAGYWTLQAGIFPENSASLALHGSLGFRVVGVRERLGRMGDRWRDVVLLERRSALR